MEGSQVGVTLLEINKIIISSIKTSKKIEPVGMKLRNKHCVQIHLKLITVSQFHMNTACEHPTQSSQNYSVFIKTIKNTQKIKKIKDAIKTFKNVQKRL